MNRRNAPTRLAAGAAAAAAPGVLLAQAERTITVVVPYA
jgi:hypothetical protein